MIQLLFFCYKSVSTFICDKNEDIFFLYKIEGVVKWYKSKLFLCKKTVLYFIDRLLFEQSRSTGGE